MNRIKQIDAQSLMKLKNLDEVKLHQNPCIDMDFADSDALDSMVEVIAEKCGVLTTTSAAVTSTATEPSNLIESSSTVAKPTTSCQNHSKLNFWFLAVLFLTAIAGLVWTVYYVRSKAKNEPCVGYSEATNRLS